MFARFRSVLIAAILSIAATVPAFAQFDGIGNPRPLTAQMIAQALGYMPARSGMTAGPGNLIFIISGDTHLTVPTGTATLLTTTGDGSGLTNISASQIATGTIASARISGSYTGITAIGTLTAGDTSASIVRATGSSVSRSLAARMAEIRNVKDYGALGNGSADDGTAIAAAITAAAAGDIVLFPPSATCYKITTQVYIGKSLTVSGKGAQLCQTSASTAALAVGTSDVHIDGLKITGPTPSTFDSASVAISITGVFNAGVAPGYISKVSVTNTIIDQWNGYGILASYVDQFEATNNRLTNIVYGGITIASGKNGRVTSNTIDTINCNGTPGGNCYGIALTRRTDDSGELVSQPRTSDYAVTGNTIRNVPTWEAIDTHAGQRIAITGNTIYGTKSGIMVGTANNASSVETYAPLLVSVAGNTMESGVTDGSASYGIVLQGAQGVEYATGSISGNTIKGYGDQTVGASGAIYVRNSSGASITGNVVVNPAPQGIVFYHDNVGFSATGNAIVDPWTNTVGVGQAIAIDVNSANNTGYIGGNTFSTNGLSATYLLSSAGGAGIRIEDVSGTAIQLGSNRSSATIYVYDQGARASTTLRNTSVATITSGVWNGTQIGVAYGGTNCVTAAGACLDNITGFGGTGFIKRTGAGTYTFTADPSDVTSVYGRTGAVVAATNDYNFNQLAGNYTLAQGPTLGASTVLGSVAGGTPAALTQAQLTALVNGATASLPGLMPAYPGNTTTFHRGDNTFATLNVAAVSGAAPAASPTFTGTSTFAGGATISSSGQISAGTGAYILSDGLYAPATGLLGVKAAGGYGFSSSSSSSGGNDTALTRVSAAVVAIGNGAQGDFSGTLKAATATFTSAVSGVAINAGAGYTTGSTTPSVTNVNYMRIGNSGATTITNFTGAVNGQVLHLIFTDANTTINRTAAFLAGGVIFVSATNATLTLVYSTANSTWYEVSRSISNN